MRLLLLVLVSFSATLAQKKPVTLEALDQSAGRPTASPANPLAWRPDGKTFVYRQDRKLMLYDPASRTSTELMETGALDGAAIRGAASGTVPFAWENRGVREAAVQWSASGKEILYLGGGDLFLIHVGARNFEQITKTAASERDPKLSPDGKKAAFRRDWDSYVIDLESGAETRLTSGGSENLRNGGLDWVYPEELRLPTAYWWSPDSRSIAYLQFDVSRQPVYPHADFRGPRAVFEPQRYPQAGDDNPDVRLGVVAATGGATRWLDVGDTRNTYLVARAGWTPDSKSVYAVRLNRVQNRLAMISIAVESGTPTVLFEEADRYWINPPEDPQFVNGGKQFLWLSERDGFRHLYRYSINGKDVRQLTSGSWEVTRIAGADDEAERIFYVSSEASPLERQLYSIGLDGKQKRLLTPAAGTHTISMGPGGAFYIDTHSSLTSPPRATVHAGDGREIGVYREADRKLVEEFDIRPTEMLTFKDAKGTLFYARLIKPAGFQTGRKYPVIVRVYGGPAAQTVLNSWGGVNIEQVYAHRGFVVWAMDNRGSAGRGHAFEAPLFRNMGPTELADQKAGVEHLISLGFVDPQRVGIQGASYGGFMTLNALLNAPEVFHAGVAGAPVTNWRNYDSIYTERYMGLPSENVEGYKNTSLVAKAANLRGKLMIYHNLEDDNVLFQNSMQMIEALEQAGKQFELQIYPQKTHPVTGALGRQLNATALDFFERALK